MLIDVEEARLIPEVPRGSAKPNQRPGRIPASTRTPPRARFQGRERRKAPGYSPERFRSREALPKLRRRRTILLPRLPDFKGVDAGRPRKDFLSQHSAARNPFQSAEGAPPPPRSPDFKAEDAGRPRVILLSDSAAAKRRGPAKEKTRGLPMGSQALTA